MLINNFVSSETKNTLNGQNRIFSTKKIKENKIGLELAIEPPPPHRANFVHYDFLKQHYIRHKIKDVSLLRVAVLACNITLYTLPPK